MQRGLYAMSQREIDRVGVIQPVIEKRIKQGEAGKRLKVSCRQIRRMVSLSREIRQ